MTEQFASSLSPSRRSFLLGAGAMMGSGTLMSVIGGRAAMAQAAGATLVVASTTSPQSLDSEFDGSQGTLDAIGTLYDSLIAYKKVPDPDHPGVLREDLADHPDLPGNINAEGKLAESWTVDPEGCWAEFKLREGVKSAWGNELTAEDPWARDFISNNAVGFGPYTIEDLTRGQQVVYKAREDYYLGKPAIDRVIYREVPTWATRVALLQGGSVDIAQSLQPLEIATLKTVPGVVVQTVKASPMIYIGLNTKFEPFDKIPVRQAMNHAFPRQLVLETIFQNTASPMTGCMPSFYPGFFGDGVQFDYDLDKAKALLAEAGVPDGFSTTLAYNAGDPLQEPMAILYQSSLRQIGIDLGLKKTPAGTYYNEISGRTQPMIISLDNPWTADPGYAMFLSFQSVTYSNFSNYKNARVDELLAEAGATADNAKRVELMTEVQKIIMVEAPRVMIAYPNYTMAKRDTVDGFAYYTSNNLRFQDFSKKV
jgi:ABC-type transport system substrate-binding protein